MTGLRRVLGAGAAAVVLILCGCTAQPQDCARSSVQCVGLVTGFGSIEAGLAHEAWLGLQDAKAEGLIQRADFIETIDTRDRAANISTFTDQGYDLVVTTGAGIAEETIAAAQDHPELHFVTLQPTSSAASTPGNIVAIPRFTRMRRWPNKFPRPVHTGRASAGRITRPRRSKRGRRGAT